MSIKFHPYCGGELRIASGKFRCSNCGVTGTVDPTPGEITLADVRTAGAGLACESIVTDREIQSYETDNERLQQMLRELVEWRRAARTTLTEHDLCRPHGHNPAIELGRLVNRAGCQWWGCTAHAATQRNTSYAPWHLCTAHADEGEVEDMWDMKHPANQIWHKEDHDRRATARRRTIEMIAEDCNTPQEGNAP